MNKTFYSRLIIDMTVKNLAVLIVALVSGITVFSSPASAQKVPTARLSYVINETGGTAPVQFEVSISRFGVRYDYRKKDEYHSLLYRADSPPALYTLNHRNVRAYKITRTGIRNYVELIKKRRKKIKNRLRKLPEGRRKAVKKRMDIMNINPERTLKRPRFQKTGDTIWTGLPASSGQFHTADGTVGRVVMSKDPLIDLNSRESTVLKRFNRFLYRWISISSQVAGSRINSPRNLIAREYLNLLSYKNSRASMKLVDWGRVKHSKSFFRVPESFQVESLKKLEPKAHDKGH